MASPGSLACSIGIMAFNEEKNIGRLLELLLCQKSENTHIGEIIIVASGCTDGTCAICERISTDNPAVRLIAETERRGKASAINTFLREAKHEICVLQGADTLPCEDTIERLVSPFSSPAIGMAGARIVPLNRQDTLAGYTVHFLWQVHHEVSLIQPKCGELVAFRKVFGEIPADTVVDEPAIEAIVRGAGLEVVYAPEAVVMNLGPSSVREIIMRRRSITRGYLELARRTSFRTSTQARGNVVRVVLRRILSGKEPLFRAAAAISVELLARLLGRLDFHFSRRPEHLWRMAHSTKSPSDFLGGGTAR